MNGLRIVVNFNTGERAGGINPRDPNLRGHSSWQRIDQAIEVRIILDGNIAPYRNLMGVTILIGTDAVDAAIAALQSPISYAVQSWDMVAAHVAQTETDISDLRPPMTESAIAQELWNRGVLGVTRFVPAPVAASAMLGVPLP